MSTEEKENMSTEEEEDYDNIEICEYILCKLKKREDNKIISTLKYMRISVNPKYNDQDYVIILKRDQIKVIYDVTFNEDLALKKIKYCDFKENNSDPKAYITDKEVNVDNLNDQYYIIGVTEKTMMYILDNIIDDM